MSARGDEGLEQPLGGVAVVDPHVQPVEGEPDAGIAGAGVVHGDVGGLRLRLAFDQHGAVGDGAGGDGVGGGWGCGHCGLPLVNVVVRRSALGSGGIGGRCPRSTPRRGCGPAADLRPASGSELEWPQMTWEPRGAVAAATREPGTRGG